MPFNHRASASEDDLFEKGEYDASVKRATPRVSKKGSNMLELILTVYGEGRRADVFDYLIDGDSTAWKIRDFCGSAGIDYDAGQIDENAIQGCSVRILLGVEPAQNGYPSKNKVISYLTQEAPPLQEPQKSQPVGPKPAFQRPPARSLPSPADDFVVSDDDVPF